MFASVATKEPAMSLICKQHLEDPALQGNAQTAYDAGQTDERPWGNWTVLATGEGFVAKLIEVKPGAKLSLQSHEHRSEHWIKISGTGTDTLGNNTQKLIENQSVFIPAKTKHRIHNELKSTLKFVEIQTGAILTEDDITRFEDSYGRA